MSQRSPAASRAATRRHARRLNAKGSGRKPNQVAAKL